jgi:hypothetical protein
VTWTGCSPITIAKSTPRPQAAQTVEHQPRRGLGVALAHGVTEPQRVHHEGHPAGPETLWKTTNKT